MLSSINNLTTKVKKQHTVPKFLLKNFGLGKKEDHKKLFTFDKKKKKYFSNLLVMQQLEIHFIILLIIQNN